jgi:hypothetical protein
MTATLTVKGNFIEGIFTPCYHPQGIFEWAENTAFPMICYSGNAAKVELYGETMYIHLDHCVVD